MQIFFATKIVGQCFSAAESSENEGERRKESLSSKGGQEEMGFSAVISVWIIDDAGIGLTDANWE